MALACPAAAQETSHPAEPTDQVEENHVDMSAFEPLGSADTAREAYEAGHRAYQDKRHGEALAYYQAAIDERKRRYVRALSLIDYLLETKDAELSAAIKESRDSINALVTALARLDLIDAELAKIDGRAGGSLGTRASLVRKEKLGSGFAGFLDGLMAVLDLRPASSLKDSVKALRGAAVELQSFPEAEYGIGEVYQAEGETRLAELQFQRAYTQRLALTIPDARFEILYGLASLYEAGKNPRSRETVLVELAAEDPFFAPEKRYLREATENILSRNGFDMFMSLARLQAGPWTEAERLLGEFYLESGRPQAVIYLGASVNENLVLAITRLAAKDSSWQYTNLPSLAAAIRADRDLASWAGKIQLWRNLHELGLALDRSGGRESAREIWTTLSESKGIEPWNSSATLALKAARP